MPKQIFVNLPVKDLERSKEFFAKLGYTFYTQFTNDKAACMVVSDTIYVMLLTEKFFKGFTPNEIADTTTSTESIICLSAESKDEVNDMVRKATEAGGSIHNQPQDYGNMYGHGFMDPDGHLWEFMWMAETTETK